MYLCLSTVKTLAKLLLFTSVRNSANLDNFIKHFIYHHITQYKQTKKNHRVKSMALVMTIIFPLWAKKAKRKSINISLKSNIGITRLLAEQSQKQVTLFLQLYN